MRLKVGLIGLGDQWQTRHGPALRALQDRFEVCAICCEVAHKSELVAKEFGAVAMDGFRAMLERNEIDAVLALAPDWVGPLPILAACEFGKAIYSSVAFDLAPEQVEDIARRIDASGVAFMTELPRRYAPATIRLKELIATRLGTPRLLFCHERHSIEQQTDRLRRGQYCSVAWRNMMELVDWACYLTDRKPTSVMSARYKQKHTQAEIVENKKSRSNNFLDTDSERSPGDTADSYYQMFNVRFAAEPGDEPAMAQISVGHYIPERWPDALSYRRAADLQICCENGTAFVDLPSSLIWFDEGGQHTESLEMDLPVGEQLLTNFHRSVTSLVRNTSDMHNAYRSMKIVMAAHQSAVEGRRMDIEI